MVQRAHLPSAPRTAALPTKSCDLDALDHGRAGPARGPGAGPTGTRDSDGSDLPCCGLLVGQALLGPGDSDADSDASERAEEALDTIRDPIPHQNVSGQSALYSTYSHTVEAKVSLFGAGVVPSGGKGLQEGAATRRPTAIRRGSMAST